jgi:hypothetical protein
MSQFISQVARDSKLSAAASSLFWYGGRFVECASRNPDGSVNSGVPGDRYHKSYQ